jgi:galactokinase
MPRMKSDLLTTVRTAHRARFGRDPEAVAYAPGRIEVLGNHTDYNEGFVLSAAIDRGIAVALSRSDSAACLLHTESSGGEASFALADAANVRAGEWSAYPRGVWTLLRERGLEANEGFLGTIASDLPGGAGLSSSAALEMASGLAFSGLYGFEIDRIELAKIGQRAEHDYAGVQCGLLDQISSLFGAAASLVFTDFRTLQVDNDPLPDEAVFVLANTHAKHSLVESEYNERRAACEQAAAFFADRLDRPGCTLRDVTLEELARCERDLPGKTSLRARHVIGECERVLRGRAALAAGDLKLFGALMFASHESSRDNFENSCPELDAAVDAAHREPAALGARLSGGGFGGSAIVLTRRADAESVADGLRQRYRAAVGRPLDCRVLTPSDGAVLQEE